MSGYQREEAQGNLQNLELCRALVNIAQGLEIKVVITGIEDEQHLHQFNTLKIEGYQGYISAPVAI